MLKSKRSTKKHKISQRALDEQKCLNEEKTILFSFSDITQSKDYSFEYFEDEFRKELEARKELEKFLQELSGNTWISILQRNKYTKCGCERMSIGSIKKSIYQKAIIAPDASVFVFRFGRNDAYRLIGFKPSPCQRLNILGYDFDHSAYNHGK